MKYDVRIGDRSFDVEIQGNRVLLGTREVAASLLTLPHGPLRRLDMAGESRTYAVLRVATGWTVHRGGRSWSVRVVDERARTVEKLVGRGAAPATDGAVRAPMPGLVLRVEVAEGQAVAAGAGLVVLEAMKMENEIRAPVAGTIRKVLVERGQAVEKGAVLVEMGQG